MESCSISNFGLQGGISQNEYSATIAISLPIFTLGSNNSTVCGVGRTYIQRMARSQELNINSTTQERIWSYGAPMLVGVLLCSTAETSYMLV